MAQGWIYQDSNGVWHWSPTFPNMPGIGSVYEGDSSQIASPDSGAAPPVPQDNSGGSTTGGGTTGGGTTGSLPDFNALLAMAQSSPFWLQAEDARRAADAAELASVQEAARGGVIGWGENINLPDAWSKYQLLNEQTQALAQQNTKAGLSTLARLREGRDINIRDLVRSLSARGLRRSGSRLYGMNKANLGFERQSTDARNALLAQIAQRLGAYSNNAYSRMMGNQNLMSNILAMLSQNWNTGGTTPGTSADPTPTPSPNNPDSPTGTGPMQGYTEERWYGVPGRFIL